jgi:membrane carboxypeptidase/penicillin-binding protein
MSSAMALDSTMGALLLAVILSAVVYGINCLQAYIYYTEASIRDSNWLKTFVSRMPLQIYLRCPDGFGVG